MSSSVDAEKPDLSVIIPVNNEAENIGELVREIQSALEPDIHYELIVVDDGSTDTTRQILLEAQRSLQLPLIICYHDRPLGQSTAMHNGMLQARGRWIATLDGDGQNVPADIPKLLEASQQDANIGLVIGHRTQRRDTLSKRLASKFANAIRGTLLRDNTPDTGCGLKLVRRDVLLQLPYFDHMHRFMPALVQSFGYETRSVPVQHRERVSGRSHYGNLERALNGILDLFGVAWLIYRNRKKLPLKKVE